MVVEIIKLFDYTTIFDYTGLIIKKNQYSYHHLSLEWKKISYLHVETTKASNTSVFFVCVECFCCKQALGPSVTHLVHLATRLV